MKTPNSSVLILSPFFRPNIGGVETHLNDLCEYLRSHGFYTYVLTYQPLTTQVRGLALEKEKNLEIRRVPWFGHNLFHKLEPYPLIEFLYLFPRLFVATLLFMIRHPRRIDAIHAHGFIAAMIARLVTLLYPKTTTMSTHAIYEFRQRGLMAQAAKWILEGFDTIMPLAQASEKDLLDAGIAPDKIVRYAQWVDQKLFKPRDKQTCRQKLQLPDRPTVLFVGRLIEKKGAGVLLEIAKQLPSVSFVFVGDGPMLPALKKAQAAAGNISTAGRKDQNETALYYGAADIVAVPSQYEEGFARVVLEALSSGRPVIAANKGCLPQMITDQVGILLEPTATKIKKALTDLIENPPKLQKLTAHARPYAEEHFSEKNAAVIAQTYLKKHAR